MKKTVFIPITQIYSVVGTGSHTRLRCLGVPGKEGAKYTKTFKSGHGLTRTEIESEIKEELFMAHLQERSFVGQVLRKHRAVLDFRKKKFEFNYHSSGYLNGLVTMEVEFEKEDDFRGFVPPDWIAPALNLREVTHDVRYESWHLALHGLPNDFNTPLEPPMDLPQSAVV